MRLSVGKYGILCKKASLCDSRTMVYYYDSRMGTPNTMYNNLSGGP